MARQTPETNQEYRDVLSQFLQEEFPNDIAKQESYLRTLTLNVQGRVDELSATAKSGKTDKERRAAGKESRRLQELMGSLAEIGKESLGGKDVDPAAKRRAKTQILGITTKLRLSLEMIDPAVSELERVVKALNLGERIVEDIPNSELQTSYKELRGVLEANPAMDALLAKEINNMMAEIKDVLYGRVSMTNADKIRSLASHWPTYFRVREFVSQESGQVVGLNLEHKPGFVKLAKKVASGKADATELDFYNRANADYDALYTKQLLLTDEVNGLLAKDFEVDFHEALKLRERGEPGQAKELLHMYKRACEARGINTRPQKEGVLDIEYSNYMRATLQLKEISLEELSFVYNELNAQKRQAMFTRQNFDFKGAYKDMSSQRRIVRINISVDSQSMVLKVAEALLASAGSEYHDLSVVLNKLSSVTTASGLKKLLTDNGVGSGKTSRLVQEVWGDWRKVSFQHWQTKFGTEKGINNRYVESLDVLRRSEQSLSAGRGVMYDELVDPSNPGTLDFGKILRLEETGQYELSSNLHRKHFAIIGAYQKWEKKLHMSFEDYENSSDALDVWKRVAEHIDGLYRNSPGALTKLYGKGYEKPYDEWDKYDAKLLAITDHILQYEYEKALHTRVASLDITQDLYGYYEELKRTMGDEGAYEFIKKHGIPKGLDLDKYTAMDLKNYRDYLRLKNSGQEIPESLARRVRKMKPVSEDFLELIQFARYDDNYKEWNDSWNFFRMTLEEKDDFLDTLPIDIAGIMVSAGLSSLAGKGVSTTVARKWFTEAAISLERGAAREAFKRGAVREAFQIVRAEAIPRAAGFAVETALFTMINTGLQYVRSGFNARLLTNWKGHLAEWGHSAVTLGILRVTELPIIRFMSEAGSIAKAAVKMPLDITALTASGAGLEYMAGRKVDASYFRKSIRTNIVMVAGITGTHTMLGSVKGFLSGNSARMMRNRQSIFDAETLADMTGSRKGLSAARTRELADYNQQGAAKGEVNLDPLHADCKTPEHIKAKLAFSKARNLPVEFWNSTEMKERPINEKLTFMEQVSVLEAKPETMTREGLMKIAEEGTLGPKKVRAILGRASEIPLKADDIHRLTEKDPEFIDADLAIKISLNKELSLELLRQMKADQEAAMSAGDREILEAAARGEVDKLEVVSALARIADKLPPRFRRWSTVALSTFLSACAGGQKALNEAAGGVSESIAPLLFGGVGLLLLGSIAMIYAYRKANPVQSTTDYKVATSSMASMGERVFTSLTMRRPGDTRSLNDAATRGSENNQKIIDGVATRNISSLDVRIAECDAVDTLLSDILRVGDRTDPLSARSISDIVTAFETIGITLDNPGASNIFVTGEPPVPRSKQNVITSLRTARNNERQTVPEIRRTLVDQRTAASDNILWFNSINSLGGGALDPVTRALTDLSRIFTDNFHPSPLELIVASDHPGHTSGQTVTPTEAHYTAAHREASLLPGYADGVMTASLASSNTVPGRINAAHREANIRVPLDTQTVTKKITDNIIPVGERLAEIAEAVRNFDALIARFTNPVELAALKDNPDLNIYDAADLRAHITRELTASLTAIRDLVENLKTLSRFSGLPDSWFERPYIVGELGRNGRRLSGFLLALAVGSLFGIFSTTSGSVKEFFTGEAETIKGTATKWLQSINKPTSQSESVSKTFTSAEINTLTKQWLTTGVSKYRVEAGFDVVEPKPADINVPISGMTELSFTMYVEGLETRPKWLIGLDSNALKAIFKVIK